MSDEFKKSDVEILVATMNRSNLDFLIPMFPFADFADFNILVINQTSHGQIASSDFANVRIINSFERGLSKSRNLALENALGKILLIADDDVVYKKDFDQNVIYAYNSNKNASMICFETETFEDEPVRKYKSNYFWMKKADFLWVLSIEISFKRNDLLSNGVFFNEHFGLGAKFQDAESMYFLRSANFKGLKILFAPKFIVKHQKYSSSDDINSERWLYAKGAGFYKRYKGLSYFLIFKVVFFLLRKSYISINQANEKIKIGLKGIKDYKKLIREGSENFYD